MASVQPIDESRYNLISKMLQEEDGNSMLQDIQHQLGDSNSSQLVDTIKQHIFFAQTTKLNESAMVEYGLKKASSQPNDLNNLQSRD